MPSTGSQEGACISSSIPKFCLGTAVMRRVDQSRPSRRLCTNLLLNMLIQLWCIRHPSQRRWPVGARTIAFGTPAVGGNSGRDAFTCACRGVLSLLMLQEWEPTCNLNFRYNTLSTLASCHQKTDNQSYYNFLSFFSLSSRAKTRFTMARALS